MGAASRETCASGSTTSFQKKSRSKLIQIPGTKPSVHTGQLIVSSGVPSLDCALGEILNCSHHQLISHLKQHQQHLFTIIKPSCGVLCNTFMHSWRYDLQNISRYFLITIFITIYIYYAESNVHPNNMHHILCSIMYISGEEIGYSVS